jgi:hypothetical protein
MDAWTVHDPEEGDEPAEPVAPGEEEDDMSIITDAAKQQLRHVLANLQAQLPPPVVQAAWATLSADQQQAFAQLSAP